MVWFLYDNGLRHERVKPGGVILARGKIEKNIKFSGGNIFPHQWYCQKIGVRICRNSFSRRNKYVHT